MTPMVGTKHMSTVAVGIMCKTPSPGQSKTRLSPPLQPHECAELSACFIRDLSRTIDALAGRGDVTGYAVYTPVGSEDALRRLLPAGFKLMPQIEGALGARLIRATADLLDAGHRAVILVGSDSPTLPRSILGAAVDAVVAGQYVPVGDQMRIQFRLADLGRIRRAMNTIAFCGKSYPGKTPTGLFAPALIINGFSDCTPLTRIRCIWYVDFC